jgi:hypothetical protein
MRSLGRLGVAAAARSVGLLAVLGVVCAMLLAGGRPAESSDPPLMRLQPSPIKIDGGAGIKFNLDVYLDGVTNLGAFEFDLTYDPAFVTLASHSLGPFLGSSGRLVSCPTAVTQPGLLNFGCNTQGPAPPGPNVGGVIATVSFVTKGAIGETSLRLSSCQAADIFGVAIFNDTCKDAKLRVNGPSPTPTATATSTPTITPTPIPHNLKLPALANLFLTHQGAKLAPATCDQSTDVFTFTHELSSPPTSPDPKNPGETQRIGAFEFEVRFDPKLVCVNLEPGQYATDTGMACFVDDKNEGLRPQGLARIGCVTKSKLVPPSSSLELGKLHVRPQPELYTDIRPNQDNWMSVKILNQDCNMADLQGHQILKTGCDDSSLIIRWLEGDVNGDCRVDLSDQQRLASRWGAQSGSGLYNARLDLEPSGFPAGGIEGDGDIDIKDIQFVYGRHGSTCDLPHPPQGPTNPNGKFITPTPTPSPTMTLSPTVPPTFTPTTTATPIPGKPRINKSPAVQDLLLTSPPAQCETGPDFVTFDIMIKDPITSPDPKNPMLTQVLGAFEFDLTFNPALLCVEVAPGNIPQGEMTCITNDMVAGVVEFGCLSQGKDNPPSPQPPGVLAVVTVRPQPAVYAMIGPGEKLVTKLVNLNCNLADIQGHHIKSTGCYEGFISIRYP